MAKRRKTLLTHVFKGARFAEAGLAVESLAELVAIRSIIIEIAKDIWRSRNPNLKKLPDHFEKRLELLMFDIKPGSAAVPLERVLEVSENDLQLEVIDEFEEAATAFIDTVDAARKGIPLSTTVSKRVLIEFENYGKTIQENEEFELLHPGNDIPVVYDEPTRQKLILWQPTTHHDRLEIEGELRMVDIDSHRFKLLTQDGTKHQGNFSIDKEKMMTEALNQHETKRVRLVVRAEIDSISGRPKRIVEVEDSFLVTSIEERIDHSAKPINEIASEIFADITDSQWEELPTDLAENADEYIRKSI